MWSINFKYLLVTEGIKEDEKNRGFNSKIVITYDVRLKIEPE